MEGRLTTLKGDGHPYHYVPILKAKQAEFGALPTLEPDVARAIRPLFEIKAIVGQESQGKKILEKWGADNPFFIDLVRPGRAGDLDQATHLLARIADYGRLQGLYLIPTIRVDSHPSYRLAVRDVMGKDRRGVLLRLEPNQLPSAPGTTRKVIDQLLHDLAASPDAIDLMIDFGPIGPDQAAITAHAAKALLTALPHLPQWRAVILSSTAFPKSLADVAISRSEDDLIRSGRISRADWEAWTRVVDHGPNLSQRLVYSDHCVEHPSDPEVDPRGLPNVPNIRYATEAEWLILRGRDLRKVETPQFSDLCRMLIGTSDYEGPLFSWGDCYFKDCAEGNIRSPKNHSDYRKPAVGHHITMVVRQISALDRGPQR